MAVLAVDYGRRRIGLAVSDAEERIALPLETLRSRGEAQDLRALERIARERDVKQLVVGLPVHMDGRKGPEAEAARAFAERLGAALGLPVELLDERWTTLEAERALRETGRRGRRQREVVDAVAATFILRTWLERPR